jgi:hypothetical protein
LQGSLLVGSGHVRTLRADKSGDDRRAVRPFGQVIHR